MDRRILVKCQRTRSQGLRLVSADHFALDKLEANHAALLLTQGARVFFSDNGSIAVEVALKMALQHGRKVGVAGCPRWKGSAETLVAWPQGKAFPLQIAL